MNKAVSRRGGSRAVVAAGLAILCGIAPWWGRVINAKAAEEEEVPTRSTRSTTHATASRSADTSRSSRAASSDSGREARIEAKLDQILANQEQILAKLDAVMEELKIVKIRATVR